MNLGKRSGGRRSVGGLALVARITCIGLLLGGAVSAGAGIYESDGSLGDLILDGVTVKSITISTDPPQPIIIDTTDGAAVGLKFGTFVDGVAVFQFTEVNVAPEVVVTTTGAAPCSIISGNNMYWGASIDVSAPLSGSVGRFGGGAGGKGGDGGKIGRAHV